MYPPRCVLHVPTKVCVACTHQGVCCMHGWEIAVILRNFRKTKLSKSKFLFLNFFFYSISTCIQCATRRLSLCDIRKYRFPALYGTSARQAAIFFCTRMIQTTQSLEFVAETRILAEMKIENRGKFFFRGKQIDKHTFFF